MEPSGLSEFLAIARDFKQIQSLVFKGMMAVPLAAIWLKLGPPTNNSTAALVTVTELLAFVMSFHLWYRLLSSELRRRFVISTCLCFTAIIAMIYLVEHYTVSGIGKDRIVIGTRVREDVARLLGRGYTTSDALEESEYDATRVWTADSIHTVSTVLELNWLIAVTTYTAALASFAMLQRRTRGRRDGRSAEGTKNQL